MFPCVIRKAVVINNRNNNVIIFYNLLAKGLFFKLLPPRGGAAGTAQNRLEPAGSGESRPGLPSQRRAAHGGAPGWKIW